MTVSFEWLGYAAWKAMNLENVMWGDGEKTCVRVIYAVASKRSGGVVFVRWVGLTTWSRVELS